MVKPQDSGQPRHGSVGEPGAGKPDERHPGTRKRREPDTATSPAEGNDSSLTHGAARERKPHSP